MFYFNFKIQFNLVCDRDIYPTIGLSALNLGGPIGVYTFGLINDKLVFIFRVFIFVYYNFCFYFRHIFTQLRNSQLNIFLQNYSLQSSFFSVV